MHVILSNTSVNVDTLIGGPAPLVVIFLRQHVDPLTRVTLFANGHPDQTCTFAEFVAWLDSRRTPVAAIGEGSE